MMRSNARSAVRRSVVDAYKCTVVVVCPLAMEAGIGSGRVNG